MGKITTIPRNHTRKIAALFAQEGLTAYCNGEQGWRQVTLDDVQAALKRPHVTMTEQDGAYTISSATLYIVLAPAQHVRITRITDGLTQLQERDRHKRDVAATREDDATRLACESLPEQRGPLRPITLSVEHARSYVGPDLLPFPSFAEADAALNALPELRGRKLTVRLYDRATGDNVYVTRVDVEEGDLRRGMDLSTAVRQDVAFHAALWVPPHMSDEAYKTFHAGLVRQERRETCAFVWRTYALTDPGSVHD